MQPMLKTEADLEPCQTFKLERFVKQLLPVKKFSKMLHLRCLTWF